MSSRNVIWITVDSVRADRTTIGKHVRDTTPRLQQIASGPSAAAFPNCLSHAIWSLPSVASMLTGTYPSVHGTGWHNDTLPEQLPTIPERLSERGWRTIGISSNDYVSEATGLDRGFDEFQMLTPRGLLTQSRVRTLASFLAGLRHHSGGFQLDQRRHNANYLINEFVKDRLSTLAQEETDPFFLYAHYSGVHHPYYPPPAARAAFVDELESSPLEASDLAFDLTTDVYREIARDQEFTETERRALEAMYDAMLRYCDSLLGGLYAHITSLDLDDTIVVITADHGDLLGERGLLSHKLVLDDALVRVPLVVSGVDGLTDVDGALVQHTDVMRAVLNDIGAEDVPVDGVDPRTCEREFAVSQRGGQTYQTTVTRVRDHNPSFDSSAFHPGVVTAVRSHTHKYVRSADRDELFALPDETRDVGSADPQTLGVLRAFADDWADRHQTSYESDGEREYSTAAKKRLRQLGYLGE